VEVHGEAERGKLERLSVERLRQGESKTSLASDQLDHHAASDHGRRALQAGKSDVISARREGSKEKSREIPLCAGRPFHRSERGRKNRPASFGMTVGVGPRSPRIRV
jgi:hypothetical protein